MSETELDLMSDFDPQKLVDLLQTMIAKPWREKYKGGIDYMRDNYLSVHPNKIPLERLEQLQRNLKKWLIKFTFDDEIEIKQFTEDVLDSIKLRIEYLKLNPTDPQEQFLIKILPTINRDLFHNSTMQQWKDLIAGNYSNLEIEVKQTAKLYKVIAVIDEVVSKLNGFGTLADYEHFKIFFYKGRSLTAKQMSDARGNNNVSIKIEHYFN